MSDSDDSRPLAAKRDGAARKPQRPVADSSNSDEDKPLARKAAAKKPAAKSTKAGAEDAAKKKPVVKKAPAKAEPAKKKSSVTAGGTADAVEPKQTQPRVKKEYGLPGQTRDTPSENDSLRKFYTSLLGQRPESEMAMKWCVQHGVLPREKALKWVDQLPKKGGAGRSPAKSGSRPAAKRGAAAMDDDNDFKQQPKKKPAPTPTRKKQAAAVKQEAPESEEEWSSDGEEVVPQKKKRPPLPSAAANGAVRKAPLIPRKQPLPSTKKDVAFDDGGMGDDSDDDVPLAARKAA